MNWLSGLANLFGGGSQSGEGNQNYPTSGQMLAYGGLQGLMNGSLFGGSNTSSGNSQTSGWSGFDRSQLPLFNQALGQSDAASAQLRSQINAQNAQRMNALNTNLNQQMVNAQGYGNQAISDVNQRYNSAQGGVGQQMASRGLYNSTVAPGMSALVERERNQALGQAQARQQQYMGSLLGQRTSALDNALTQGQGTLNQLGFQDYGLRSLLPQAVAQSRTSGSTTTTQSTDKKKGLLSGLFG